MVKPFIFPGEWRQIGPLCQGDSPTDVVDIAFISSPLWEGIKRFQLTKSQRDKKDPQYAAFVQDIGENKISLTSTIMPDGQTLILTPLNNHSQPSSDDHFQLQYTTYFDELINFVYPDMTEDAPLWNDLTMLDTTNYTIDRSTEAYDSFSAFHA